MTAHPSNYCSEHSPYGSYSLFQFEGSDVTSVLKNPLEYSFVFLKAQFIRRAVAVTNQIKIIKFGSNTAVRHDV